jgi:hypothetical protein
MCDPKRNRRGNIHWTDEQGDAIRATLYHIRERLLIDLSHAGVTHEQRMIAFESVMRSSSAIWGEGQRRPFEDKTPRQQTHERRAQVIDITPRFKSYLSR